jgi:hypothetical protein
MEASLTGLSTKERVMTTGLTTALRESCGYLQDEGWHQTAQLMTLAAQEIERLAARARELETRANLERPRGAAFETSSPDDLLPVDTATSSPTLPAHWVAVAPQESRPITWVRLLEVIRAAWLVAPARTGLTNSH